MRLTLSTLPQLAVLAKILCLLMVVMCGAVPSTVPSVSLYSTCSRGYVTVYGKTVKSTLRNEHNAPYQKMTTQSQDFSRKLYIFAEKSKRYICFNKRWKIVTLPEKRRNEYCQFNETYNGRYLRYHSVVDPTRYIGFSKTGKPITWPKGRQECYNFLKMNPQAGVERHNSLITSAKGGGMKHPEHRNALRALANSLASTSSKLNSKNSLISPSSSSSSVSSSISSSISSRSSSIASSSKSPKNGFGSSSGSSSISSISSSSSSSNSNISNSKNVNNLSTSKQLLTSPSHQRRHRHRHGKSWDQLGTKRRRHHRLQPNNNNEKY